MFSKVVVLLGILCGFFSLVEPKTDRVICYYGSWANYRNGNGKYTAENIDPQLCTHAIYTFLGIANDGSLKILDSWLELDLRNLVRFNSLKAQNSNLKTLIAVGGWNEGSVKYSAVARDPTKRATLIRSALNILETYGFDGFDIDWEYPAQRGGSADDKKNFAILLKEFREAFDKRGYILTAAVAAAPSAVDASYDVPALSRYLDSINVMAYDLHGAYDGVTGANAPLYPSSVDVSASAKLLTVDASIRGWISRGADPQKISMGLPLYGRTFTLSNPSLNGVGAPASIGGKPGPYTQETGMLGYLEICELQKEGGWTIKWDDNTKTPYAYKGDQWIGYDNAESIRLKVEYAKSLNLGGTMIWSVETADFNGVCGDKYPILKVIKDALNEKSSEEPVEPDVPETPKGDDKESDKSEERKEPDTPEPSEGEDKKSEETDDKKEPDSKESDKSGDKKEPDSSEASKESDKKSDDEKKPDDSDESKESEKESKENSSEESKESDSSSSSESKEDDDAVVCEQVGMFRSKQDCSSFYYCISDIVGLRKVDFKCSEGLLFDSRYETCNFKNLVDCDA